MMPTWLAILLGFTTLISTGVAIFVAWISQKIRADFYDFELRITKLLDMKLDRYVTESSFQTYSEAHAREHIAINAEIIRLRDQYDNNRHRREDDE